MGDGVGVSKKFQGVNTPPAGGVDNFVLRIITVTAELSVTRLHSRRIFLVLSQHGVLVIRMRLSTFLRVEFLQVRVNRRRISGRRRITGDRRSRIIGGLAVMIARVLANRRARTAGRCVFTLITTTR